MRIKLALIAIALTTSVAEAGSQSSNSSSNSSSDNGVVRERFVDTYCEDDYCERTVERRIHRKHRPRHPDWYYEEDD